MARQKQRGLDMIKNLAVALGVFAFMTATVGTAGAQNKCAGSKMKMAGKKASCLLGLEGKEASKAVAKDPVKVAACRQKMTEGFAKAEAAKGRCPTSRQGGAL